MLVYERVTLDELQLPILQTDTIEEMSKLTGVPAMTIRSQIWRQSRGLDGKYEFIEVDIGDEDTLFDAEGNPISGDFKTQSLAEKAKKLRETHEAKIKSGEIKRGRGAKKKVYAYDKETGEFLKSFNSMREAATTVDSSSLTGIRRCCLGEVGSSMGYRWSFEKKTNIFN